MFTRRERIEHDDDEHDMLSRLLLLFCIGTIKIGNSDFAKTQHSFLQLSNLSPSPKSAILSLKKHKTISLFCKILKKTNSFMYLFAGVVTNKWSKHSVHMVHVWKGCTSYLSGTWGEITNDHYVFTFVITLYQGTKM